MERIRLDLEAQEYRGLATLAERELRPLTDQARLLIRDALKRRGLLTASSPNSTPPAQSDSVDPRA